MSVFVISDFSFTNILARVQAILADTSAILKTPNCLGPANLAVVGDSQDEILTKLADASRALQNGEASGDGSRGFYYQREPLGAGSLVFVLPGQGSQYPGMLRSLRGKLHLFDDTAREYDEMWRRIAGKSLLETIDDTSSPVASQTLADTRVAQPAIGMLSAALAATFAHHNIIPNYVAGHSYGELTSLWFKGAFDTNTLLSLSKRRGELMAEANEMAPGAMLAVMDSRENAETLIEGMERVAVLASHNAPRQFVISGEKEAIEDALARAKKKNIVAKRLNTSAAFHSPLMKAVAKEWKETLESAEIVAPQNASVFSTVTSDLYGDSKAEVREQLYNQFCSPVLWIETIENIFKRGGRIFLEVGPNGVLTGLTSRILGERKSVVLAADPGKRDPEDHLSHLVACLSSHGVLPLSEQMGMRQIPYGAPIHTNFEIENEPLKSTTYDQGDGVTGRKIERSPENESTDAGTSGQNSFFESNQRVVETFFRQQQSFAKCYAPSDDESRAQILKQILKTNEAIMTAFLETQATGAGALLGGAQNCQEGISQQWLQPHEDVPLEVVKTRSSTEVTEATHKNEIEEELANWLRRTIADLTGFPENVITRKSDLANDLGLDSITTLEVYGKLVEAFPHLGGRGSLVRSAITFGDVLDALAQKGALENAHSSDDDSTYEIEKKSDDKCETVCQKPTSLQSELCNSLLTICSNVLSIPISQVKLDVNLDTGLGVDLFTQREIMEKFLEVYPALTIVGEHFRGLKTLRDIVDTSVKILAPKKSESSNIRRYRREEIEIQLTEVTMPRSVLLVSSNAIFCEWIRNQLENDDVEVKVLRLTPKGWSLGDDDTEVVELENVQRLAEKLQVFCSNSIGDVVYISSETNLEDKKKKPQVEWSLNADLSGTGLFVLAKAMDSLNAIPNSLGILGSLEDMGACTAARGVGRGLAHEWKNCRVRSVWVESGKSAVGADRIVQALFCKGSDSDVTIRPNEATSLCLVDSNNRLDEDEPINLSKDRPVLLIGGGDGITAQIGIGLAQRFGCPIVAIGRTPFPNDEVVLDSDEVSLTRSIRERVKQELGKGSQADITARVHLEIRKVKRKKALLATAESIKSTGAEFFYVEADATDDDQMQKAFDEVLRRFVSIQGVVVGAGILDDAPVREKSVDSFRSVMFTKSSSSFLTYQILKEQPLKFAFLMSSIVSHTGNESQTDYIAGNEIVNQVASKWNAEVSYPVRALLWSVWNETGLAPNYLRIQMTHQGLECITNKAGVAAFFDELLVGKKNDDSVILSPESVLESLVSHKKNFSMFGIPVTK